MAPIGKGRTKTRGWGCGRIRRLGHGMAAFSEVRGLHFQGSLNGTQKQIFVLLSHSVYFMHMIKEGFVVLLPPTSTVTLLKCFWEVELVFKCFRMLPKVCFIHKCQSGLFEAKVYRGSLLYTAAASGVLQYQIQSSISALSQCLMADMTQNTAFLR